MSSPSPLIACAVALFAVSAQARWISVGDAPQATPVITVTSADRAGITLALQLNGMHVEDRVAHDTPYQRISLPSGGRTADLGFPEVPCFARLIAVPRDASVEVRFTPVDSVDLPGFHIWPAQSPSTDDGDIPLFVKEAEAYRGGAVFPYRHVTITEAGIIRGYRVALLTVFPVIYDSGRSTLRVYTQSRVEVSFLGGTGEFAPPRLRSRFFEPLLRQTLLNHDAVGGFDPLPRLRQGEGELLIIAADGLVSAVAPLAQWRTATGLPTVVVSRTEAGWTAAGIGQYMQDVYDGWETPPSFVLLVGDAEILPTNYRYHHPINFNMTAADLWYFTLDGSDFFADIHYGRLSVDNVSQLNQFLTKLAAYEKTPLPGAWNTHAFLASYEEPGKYFTITSEQIYSYLTSAGYDVDRAYEAGTPPGTTQDVIDNFNQGCFLVNHRDHGGRENWVHPSFWVYDFPQVQNGQMMPMVFSINCLSGYFDSETDDTQGTFESFSEVLLRKTPGGAIGVLSSSRSSFSGYNDELNKGLIDAMWPAFDPGYPGTTENPWESPVYWPGAVLNFGKWYMYDKYVLTGGAGYPSGYPWTPTTQNTRLQMEMYHCHGDPTLDIHTAEPSPMIVSHDGAVAIGAETFDVIADQEGALAALSQDGVLLGRAYVDGGIAHIVLVRQPASGIVDVVVTAHNRIPYEQSISVVAPDGWYVSLTGFSASDVAGYVDGIIDQGDSVALAVTLHNVGVMEAPGVRAKLTTSDPNMTVTADSLWYGALPAGEASSGDGAFYIKVHGGVDDGTAVSLDLEITSGDSLWVRPLSLTIHAPLLQLAQVTIVEVVGNGNGFAEPGETVDLWVTLTNSGSGTASSLEATLSCAHQGLDIEVGETAYPDLSPGETEPALSSFRVVVDPTCPEGAVTFTEMVSGYGPLECQIPFAVTVGALSVLVVDADNEPTEQRLLDAMDELGYQYRVWRTYLQGTVPADTLALYRAVVWTGGDNNASSASPADQQNLAQYLSSGGSLLFSAENYLTSYGDASFTANYLHVEDFETGYTANWVSGLAGDPVSDGFSTGLDYPADLSNTPDALTPNPEAAALLSAQPLDKTVAIRYPATGQGPYRVIFMALPFEALNPATAPPSDPATFLQRALSWLMDEGDLVPPQPVGGLSVIPEGTNALILSWEPSWDNIGVDHYAVYRDSDPYFLPEPGSLVATTVLTTWTDPAGAGDPDVHHIYLVTAVDAAGNESPPSERVGEWDTAVHP